MVVQLVDVKGSIRKYFDAHGLVVVNCTNYMSSLCLPASRIDNNMKYFLFLALPLSACGQHQDPCVVHKPNHLMEYICEDADGLSDTKLNPVLPDHPPSVDHSEGSGEASDDDWGAVSDDSNGYNSND